MKNFMFAGFIWFLALLVILNAVAVPNSLANIQGAGVARPQRIRWV